MRELRLPKHVGVAKVQRDLAAALDFHQARFRGEEHVGDNLQRFKHVERVREHQNGFEVFPPVFRLCTLHLLVLVLKRVQQRMSLAVLGEVHGLRKPKVLGSGQDLVRWVPHHQHCLAPQQRHQVSSPWAVAQHHPLGVNREGLTASPSAASPAIVAVVVLTFVVLTFVAVFAAVFAAPFFVLADSTLVVAAPPSLQSSAS
mmetsp:Transcript_65780/g.132411  ORF Transcript_65780/g.132411 Transcript_65780/m.132411 type:complete len:201 (-) Transcript_65780:580-1182(-)